MSNLSPTGTPGESAGAAGGTPPESELPHLQGLDSAADDPDDPSGDDAAAGGPSAPTGEELDDLARGTTGRAGSDPAPDPGSTES